MNTSYVSGWTSTPGANLSTVGEVVITATVADQPLAPTPNSPASASVVNNVTQSTVFSWTYNPQTNSGSQSAYALRVKAGSGSYQYWNASTQAFQSAVAWNSSTSQSVSIPVQELMGNTSYAWSVATQESYYNRQGPFCSDVSFTTQSTYPSGFSVTGDTFTVQTISPVTYINTGVSITDSISVTLSSSQPNWKPGELNSIGIGLPATVKSKTYLSYHNVIGVQFATVQSDAVQLIPNDTMSDGLTGWTPVGTGFLTYDVNTKSLVITQGVYTPLPIVGGHSLVRPPVSPVMAEAAVSVSGSSAGIISPLVSPSANGQLYAGVKFTPLTPLGEPLELQLIANSTVVKTWVIYGYPNQQQIQVFPFSVGEYAPPGTQLQLQLIQSITGSSGNVWSVQALSLFDEGIYWEFSVDGGFTWYPGTSIRNNPYGYLEFPQPDNALVWRATFYQSNLALNEIEIRPIYQQAPFLNRALGMSGPTVEFTNNFIQTSTDPLFNQKQLPIPRSWYNSSSPLISTTSF